MYTFLKAATLFFAVRVMLNTAMRKKGWIVVLILVWRAFFRRRNFAMKFQTQNIKITTAFLQFATLRTFTLLLAWIELTNIQQYLILIDRPLRGKAENILTCLPAAIYLQGNENDVALLINLQRKKKQQSTTKKRKIA